VRVQIVGAGRVGRSLRGFLSRWGKEVSLWAYRRGEGVLKDADLLFIAVKDDHIGEVARRLYAEGYRYRAVGHLSGALTSDILKPYRERFSFHPLQAFSSFDSQLWEGITATMEGTPEGLRLLRDLFTDLPIRIVPIPAEKKALYHAAAVFVSNLIYAPLVAGEELFADLGLTRRDYAVLVRVSFENFLREGLEGLTGPLRRRDEGTLNLHRKALKNVEDILELYDILSEFLKRKLEHGV